MNTKINYTIDYNYLATLLGEASYELGQLNGLNVNMPANHILLAPLAAKEASVSSKIEGTLSEAEDVLIYNAIGETNYKDTPEVDNYRKAILWSFKELKNRDLNNAFIKDLHSILLNNVRGHDKRGTFRKEQVFIGTEGDTIEKARYVPPQHILLQDYMDEFEKYIQNSTESILISTGIMHYIFEAIHPFFDGNGRIGRLLIPLFMYKRSAIDVPIIYMSGYFESNKDLYKEKLHEVDTTNDINNWIKFFLTAVRDQCRDTSKLIKSILEQQRMINEKLKTINSKYNVGLSDFLIKSVIFTNKDLNEFIGANNRMASLRLIEQLKECGLIQESIQNNKTYYYNKEILLLL